MQNLERLTMADCLKPSYGVFEKDDFVEESGQLRELTVAITLSEYRELVASSVLQRNYIDQIDDLIDDLTEAIDFLCQLILERDPEFAHNIRDAVKKGVPPSVFEALFRVVKDGDADA